MRPNAQAVLTVQAESMRKDPNYVPQRSLFVIMKDWEQESCIILMIWALAIIVFKNRATRREQELLDGDPVRVPEGMRILPEDTREYVRQLESHCPPSSSSRWSCAPPRRRWRDSARRAMSRTSATPATPSARRKRSGSTRSCR